ncbi:MAG: hypothetical protein CM15mP97_0820 [Actinomycetota bacterium]|nr:MAG: hypothetical protein CM15mP97_0820 [Actinomycetota bacterium]
MRFPISPYENRGLFIARRVLILIIMNVVFTVPEISCGHCKDTIESTLNNVESIESVSVDIEKKSVEVISSSDLDMMNVSQLLDEQGYTVVQSE